MSETPVQELRDLQAQRAAVRQYRRAARRHSLAAAELMVKGWYGYAGESLVIADRLGAAAIAEKLTAK